MSYGHAAVLLGEDGSISMLAYGKTARECMAAFELAVDLMPPGKRRGARIRTDFPVVHSAELASDIVEYLESPHRAPLV